MAAKRGKKLPKKLDDNAYVEESRSCKIGCTTVSFFASMWILTLPSNIGVLRDHYYLTKYYLHISD